MMKHCVSRMVGPGVLAALVVASVAATIGGFELRVEVPRAGTAYSEAVVLVQTYGCAQPSKAKVEGTAEGIVNGVRRSMPLALKQVAEGIYAVERQWPAEGTWVLALTGAYRGQDSSLLLALEADGTVAMQPDEPDKPALQRLRRRLTTADVESALTHVSSSKASLQHKTKTG